MAKFPTAAITLTVALPMLVSAQPQPKNILMICIDDLKPMLGCYGYEHIKTPNIDALAAMGTVFRNNYCQQAVSGPTRASLMTGLRPDHTKVFDLVTKMRDMNPDVLSMPQYFRENGYRTIGMGKIYDPRCVDNKIDEPSWSVPFVKNSTSYYATGYGEPHNGHFQAEAAKDNPKYKPTTECVDVPDAAYKDGALALQAMDYIDKYFTDGKSTFMAVGFVKPHLPFVSPKRYWDMYDRASLPLATFKRKAQNSSKYAYTESGELNGYTDIPELITFSDIDNAILPESKGRELIHGYHAAVSYVDAQVGKVLDHLKAKGLLESTIVVLWGDHGWHLGDHGLWCKHTNFENATAAPLIMYVPGMMPGQSYSMSEFVDIFPTLCEATGLAIPTVLDGRSLMPVLRDKQAKVKEYSVSQYRREAGHRVMGYAIRTDRYRYVAWFGDYYRTTEPYDANKLINEELYDYLKDSDETISQQNTPQYAQVLSEMRAYLKEHIDSMQKR